MDYPRYYRELGRLLYAISKADGVVNKPELSAIKKIVNEELLNLEDSLDEFNGDAAYMTEFEVETLEDWDITANEAFTFFKDYVMDEKGLLPSLKVLAYKCALRVADSYNGIDEKEEKLLGKLKKLLRE